MVVLEKVEPDDEGLGKGVDDRERPDVLGRVEAERQVAFTDDAEGLACCGVQGRGRGRLADGERERGGRGL